MKTKAKGELRPIDEYDVVIGTTTLITCPWCFNPTLYTEDESECTVCRRMITQSDINNYLEEDD